MAPDVRSNAYESASPMRMNTAESTVERIIVALSDFVNSELMAAGMEIANAYTELNDPEVQEENFRRQLRGQEETMATMDEDFITALKYGMPPLVLMW